MGSNTPVSVLPDPPKVLDQLSFRLETNILAKDEYWPHKCSLMGCDNPELRPHHHHMFRGHLQTYACQCPNVDQPGTRPVGK